MDVPAVCIVHSPPELPPAARSSRNGSVARSPRPGGRAGGAGSSPLTSCPGSRSPSRGRGCSVGREETPPSQAQLLRGRGDLCKGSFYFDAKLPKAGPCARPLRDAPTETRLGFDVRCIENDPLATRSTDTPSPCIRRPASVPRAPSAGPLWEGATGAALVVSEVDTRVQRCTPVADWNYTEDRHADRLKLLGERRSSRSIHPGDRICAVNGKAGDEQAMLAELQAASDLMSPKALELRVERPVDDILLPAAPLAGSCMAPPAHLPALPPRPRERVSSSGISTRASSRCHSEVDVESDCELHSTPWSRPNARLPPLPRSRAHSSRMQQRPQHHARRHHLSQHHGPPEAHLSISGRA
eukprot:TRINITY_DN38075_c0_g1_i1.p1 TRINITY_DN38075_c0_g1~~TRINITY_DN38075_c0_g1_i1.p1  ORF type:complete len:356 (+),score=34.87 TRINITY_DN38075_c0_g1_i1:74-1141(+)